MVYFFCHTHLKCFGLLLSFVCVFFKRLVTFSLTPPTSFSCLEMQLFSQSYQLCQVFFQVFSLSFCWFFFCKVIYIIYRYVNLFKNIFLVLVDYFLPLGFFLCNVQLFVFIFLMSQMIHSYILWKKGSKFFWEKKNKNTSYIFWRKC